MERSITKQRSKPTLVTHGKKQMTSNGRWNDNVIGEFILLHGRTKWLTLRELAGVAFHSGTPSNQERVCKCLPKLFRHMMAEHRLLLVIEYEPPHGRAKAVKIFDPTSEQDRQAMLPKLDRMKQRRELTIEQYELAIVIATTTRAEEPEGV